jgi:hypothetical protein
MEMVQKYVPSRDTALRSKVSASALMVRYLLRLAMINGKGLGV